MDAMFDALDEFFTKMQEADCKFSIFPHNLSQYGLLKALPLVIDDPEIFPTVDDWLVYFQQAKMHFQGGDVLHHCAYRNNHTTGKNHEV